MTRVAFDTNILAYIAGVIRHPDDAAKADRARTLLGRLRGRAVLIVPVQVLGELYVVLSRSGVSREDAHDLILRIHRAFGNADSASSTLLSALDLATAHHFQLWDALIINASADAGCALLLSEDMHHGFAWRGTVVLNPLIEPFDARLASLYA